MSLILRKSKHIWLLSRWCRLNTHNFSTTHQSLKTLQNIKPKPTFGWNSLRSIQSSCHLRTNLEAAYSEPSPVQDRPNDLLWLDRELYKLDTDVKRQGRLNQTAVEAMLETIKKTDKITSTQALLIIRCCGSLLAEMPAKVRMTILEDIWNNVLTQKCLLDISHYNTLLNVYLENDHKFDPIEILTLLEQKNLKPNRITYQRLISRYCREGDIGGASKILEFMKSKDMPVNENIFNDLILGHAVSNNMEDAIKILEVMRNAELSPNSSTYCSLACGYAITGDIDKILATIEKANDGDAYLTDKDILDIISHLAKNNHEDLVDQVLPKLAIKAGYNFRCANVILDLVNRGHHNVAFKLLTTMPTGYLTNGIPAPSGMFFIKQIVRVGLPKETIMHYCKELQDSDKNPNALLKASEYVLQCGSADDAVAFLKELHAQKIPQRTHYFWPVLIKKKGRDKDVYDVLKLMLDLGCPADSDTFVDYVFPHISIGDPDMVVRSLKELGYEVNEVANALALYCLLNGDPKMATNLLKKYPVHLHAYRIAPILVSVYLKSRDSGSVTEILQYIKDNPVPQTQRVESDLFGGFLQDLIGKPEINESLLVDVLKVMNNKDMKISHMAARVVSNKFCSNTEIASLLENMASSEVSARNEMENNIAKPNPATMTVDELEAFLITKKNSGMRQFDTLHKLLLLHARNKNVVRVEEIIRELDDLGFVYRGNTYTVLMELYTGQQNLDQAMHYRRLLEELHPNFRPDDHKIINLAALLVKKKKFEDAEKAIVDHFGKFGQCSEKGNNKHNVKRLLDELSLQGEVQLTRKFFEILVSYDCCEPDNIILGPLVKSHLVINDIEGAVNAFLKLQKVYGYTPCKRELFNVLIQQDDADRLQSVIDASIKVHGEENVLIELACSFVDNGRLKQARKILETPGFRVRNDRMNVLCESYLKQNKISELETFINITKDLFGVDRGGMYFYLIKGYVNADNVAKAVNVWEMMQEENVLPSDQTMHLLGTFLQQMNQPVPFAIPECSDYNRTSVFSKQVGGNDIMEVLDDRLRMKFKNGSLTAKDMTQIVQVLINRNRISDALKLTEEMLTSGAYPNLPVLRVLSNRLADVGNTSALMDIQANLPESIAEKLPFKDYIANSYIKVGRGDVFLKSLETDVFKYKNNFPGGGFMSLLQHNPNDLERAKAVVETYYKEGQHVPRNMLWMHYLKNHKFEEAQKLLDVTPEMHQRIMLRDVVSQIRGTNDLALSQELLNQIKRLEDIHERVKALVYGAHINVLTTFDKLDAAVQMVQEAQSSLGSGSLSYAALSRLQLKLKNAGMQVPFSLPEQRDKDSSDSSDSDDERR